MSTDVCIAIDSTCNLPRSFIDQNNIRVLPIALKLSGESIPDTLDPIKTLELYQSGRIEKGYDAETEPYSSVEMSRLLEEELVLNYDKVLVLTIMRTRSKTYENVRDAVFVSQPKFKDLRSQNDKDRSFRIFVFDTNTLFTGHGLLTWEAVRLLKEDKASPENIMVQLESMKDRVHAMVLPNDLFYIKQRGSTKGDKSVSWLSYQVGTMLNVKPIVEAWQGDTSTIHKTLGFKSGLEKLFTLTSQAIDKGLLIRAVVMSYAGDLAEIEGNRDYQEFVAHARSKGVETLLSIMNLTTAINMGVGAFSIAYAD